MSDEDREGYSEPIEPEVLKPEATGTTELNEFGRVSSDVLIVTGFRTNGVVTPYQCDNCGEEYAATREPNVCQFCGVVFESKDDEYNDDDESADTGDESDAVY